MTIFLYCSYMRHCDFRLLKYTACLNQNKLDFVIDSSLHFHNKFSKCLTTYHKQDACRGVHSACWREVNRHKLDICIFIRLRQGRIPGIFVCSVCRSKFPGLKVGRGSWLANMALKSSTWSRKSFFSHRQYHGFSACVDAGYDIKKSITDIQQTMQ